MATMQQKQNSNIKKSNENLLNMVLYFDDKKEKQAMIGKWRIQKELPTPRTKVKTKATYKH